VIFEETIKTTYQNVRAWLAGLINPQPSTNKQK
jgi:hypothetical protein